MLGEFTCRNGRWVQILGEECSADFGGCSASIPDYQLSRVLKTNERTGLATMVEVTCAPTKRPSPSSPSTSVIVKCGLNGKWLLETAQLDKLICVSRCLLPDSRFSFALTVTDLLGNSTLVGVDGGKEFEIGSTLLGRCSKGKTFNEQLKKKNENQVEIFPFHTATSDDAIEFTCTGKGIWIGSIRTSASIRKENVFNLTATAGLVDPSQLKTNSGWEITSSFPLIDQGLCLDSSGIDSLMNLKTVWGMLPKAMLIGLCLGIPIFVILTILVLIVWKRRGKALADERAKVRDKKFELAALEQEEMKKNSLKAKSEGDRTTRYGSSYLNDKEDGSTTRRRRVHGDLFEDENAKKYIHKKENFRIENDHPEKSEIELDEETIGRTEISSYYPETEITNSLFSSSQTQKAKTLLPIFDRRKLQKEEVLNRESISQAQSSILEVSVPKSHQERGLQSAFFNQVDSHFSSPPLIAENRKEEEEETKSEESGVSTVDELEEAVLEGRLSAEEALAMLESEHQREVLLMQLGRKFAHDIRTFASPKASPMNRADHVGSVIGRQAPHEKNLHEFAGDMRSEMASSYNPAGNVGNTRFDLDALKRRHDERLLAMAKRLQKGDERREKKEKK
eukprot:GDKJ01037654.1.p1 GENE.GDKJ01037654.1~~GDKJ01037654.1.p1  ORF type:complete len:622 (+),score=163.34 GDKJ01037654.1:914-2779(+)